MGFYRDRVLPHLVNVAMNTSALNDERRRCLEQATGAVLEIGFGTGLNLPHYPPAVTKVVAVDPSDTSARLARARIAAPARSSRCEARYPWEGVCISSSTGAPKN